MRIIMVLLALVALASCTPKEQSAFELACAGATTGIGLFADVRAKASAKAKRIVDSAWSGAEQLCSGPPPKDQAAAILAVTAASVTIYNTYKEYK